MAAPLPQDGGRSTAGGAFACQCAKKMPRTKMPFIVVANSPDKDAALAGLERWKIKHAQVAGLLAVDDVLVDSMRGTSSTWTRIRVNLRHVPEEQGRRRKLPTLTTIQRGSGETAALPGKSRSNAQRLRRKSPSAPAVEPLRAGHRYSRSASCPCAIFESAPCGGSGCLACVRKQLPPPAPAAAAPMTGLCLGSSGSSRPACAAGLRLLRMQGPPSRPRDG